MVFGVVGKPITIYGNGKQTRSFQYVDDLVEGLVKLMNSNYTLPVNIGNPDEYTIKDFAELIRSQVHNDVQIIHLASTKDDPRKRKPVSNCRVEMYAYENFTYVLLTRI